MTKIIIEVTPAIRAALNTWQAQARQELEWVYEGGDFDAKHVANALAEALCKAQSWSGSESDILSNIGDFSVDERRDHWSTVNGVYDGGKPFAERAQLKELADNEAMCETLEEIRLRLKHIMETGV